MQRVNVNPTLPDGYEDKARAIAEAEHRPFANWVAKLIICAVDENTGTATLMVDGKPVVSLGDPWYICPDCGNTQYGYHECNGKGHDLPDGNAPK